MPFFSTLWQFDMQADELFILPALLGAGVFFLLAFLCGGLTALNAESAYLRQRKAFYDKYAQQFSGTVLFAWCAALVVFLPTAARFLPLPSVLPTLRELVDPRHAAYTVPALLALITPLLWLAYIRSWSALHRHRAAHLLIGLSALLSGLFLFCLLTLLLFFIQHPYISLLLDENPGAALPAALGEFTGNTSLWPPVAYFFLNGPAAAAALTRARLILRRNKDDFGRDYYVFAAHSAARSALFFTVAATAAAALLFLSLSASTAPEFRQMPETGILLAASGLPIVCALLHLVCAFDANPLRRKAGAFGACFLQLTAFCLQLTLLINTYPAA
ncbi:MAG: hypothetical protein LBC14_07835 [Desulfovibrio sp.]|jgi:hypothetical protein|nr:hypothetical protein [Desulfovibrio sp.]